MGDEGFFGFRLSTVRKGNMRNRAMISLPLVVMLAVLCLLGSLLAGCKEEGKIDVAAKLNPKKMPTMMSRNVETLISDSGRVQYKIVSPLWYVYDETDPPYWYFPEGLYLIKYDAQLRQISSVACDTARYYKLDKLWELKGNVEMKNAPKDLFLSQRLYWNQRKHTIYSDTFMHVETETQMLEGTGFISDENLRSYRVIKPKGIFPVNRDNLRSGGGGERNASGVDTSLQHHRRPVSLPPSQRNTVIPVE